MLRLLGQNQCVKRASAVVVGLALLVAVAVLGFIAADDATAIDRRWQEFMAEMRSPLLLFFAHGLDQVGGHLVGVYLVPIAIGTTVLILRGWRSAVFAVVAFAASALIVQIAKQVFSRARPEDLLVATDFGSFPSGHTANAATILVVLWVLFPRVAVVVAGAVWVLLMAFARTVVSAHWVTDTLGGTLIGIAGGLLAIAAFHKLIEHDRPAPRELQRR